ncbi:hypothetical protein BKA69DRAFT_1138160 [Paraphysoderma sedebokerense]|nr:hypothetical protein BKA69DRAFT_1138160 [Paraphysoderma sedebokerense]
MTLLLPPDIPAYQATDLSDTDRPQNAAEHLENGMDRIVAELALPSDQSLGSDDTSAFDQSTSASPLSSPLPNDPSDIGPSSGSRFCVIAGDIRRFETLVGYSTNSSFSVKQFAIKDLDLYLSDSSESGSACHQNNSNPHGVEHPLTPRSKRLLQRNTNISVASHLSSIKLHKAITQLDGNLKLCQRSLASPGDGSAAASEEQFEFIVKGKLYCLTKESLNAHKYPGHPKIMLLRVDGEFCLNGVLFPPMKLWEHGDNAQNLWVWIRKMKESLYRERSLWIGLYYAFKRKFYSEDTVENISLKSSQELATFDENVDKLIQEAGGVSYNHMKRWKSSNKELSISPHKFVQ